MSRKLISADALLEAGRNTSEFQQHLADEYDLECLIAGMPAVDAVEVVRCKDCKHSNCGQDVALCNISWGLVGCLDLDDFCSYGERREDNE